MNRSNPSVRGSQQLRGIHGDRHLRSDEGADEMVDIGICGVHGSTGALRLSGHVVGLHASTAAFMQLPHVFLEIEIPAETFPAYPASERFLVIVGVHVKCKVIDLMECFGAHRALVSFFTAVGEFVVLVVPFLVESLAAEFAHEGFVSRVDPCVGVKGRGSVESLAAGMAFVGFFRSVDYFVSTERGCLSETFSAYFTDEWPRSSVHRHVPGEVVMSVENFAAFSALEALLFRC